MKKNEKLNLTQRSYPFGTGGDRRVISIKITKVDNFLFIN